MLLSNLAINRFLLNIKGIARMLTPSVILPLNREKILRKLDKYDLDYIKKRVDYYCPLSAKITLDLEAKPLHFLRWTHKSTAYFFDTYEYARYFPQEFRAHFAFGDVNYIPKKPSFAKSRPIYAHYESMQNANGDGQSEKSHHCESEAQSNPQKIDYHDFALQNLAMTIRHKIHHLQTPHY